MSASARFLLEFQATGDQEVVNKIREVAAAGKEAGADLESLQGIQDPFGPVTEGAERAIGPMTEVGSATEELTGVFAGAGTSSADFSANLDAVGGAADATVGGLTEANTAAGEFGGSAETASGSAATLGQSTEGAIGAFVGLGGALGSATTLAFRMQDAQLRLDKAQLKAARSTETARKAQAAFNSLLGTATTNTDGIAAASNRLSEAQAHLNELINAGVTSGPEYAAAQKEVADATAALKKEFVEGGGSAEKFDTAMGKMVNSNEAAAISLKNLEKIQRETTQTWYELPFAIAGVTGTLIQSITSMGKFAPMAAKVTMAVRGLSGALTALTGVGLAGFTVAFAAAGAAVAVFMGAVIGLNKAPYDQIIGQLDKIGKKVGEVFPQAAGMLTTLGDQMGTSLDFLAGYSRGLIKQLTGVSLQSDVTKKSFSDLVQMFLTEGTTGYTQINRAIAGYVDAAREQGLTDKEIIELAKKHNDENKKTAESTDKVATSTVEYGNAADSTMVSVDGVRTAIAYLPGSIDPANKSLVEMGTELGTAAEQMQLVEGGVMSMNAALNQSIDANALEARALLDVRDAALQNEEAISANHLAYAQSVDKVLDLNAVLGDSTARHEAVQTAVNNTAVALGEEAIQLEAASQSADDLGQKQQRLDNAFQSGVVSIKEWANGLAEAKREQEGQVSQLAAMGARWSDIPPFVERNIETLKLFGVAAKEGGDAAKEAATMASDAWRDATSMIGGELGGLADIFKEGGEKMKESTAEWFAGIEQTIGRNLTGAETAALTGIGHMIESTEQAIADWQLGQIMGESIAQTGSELATAFEGLATTAEGGMKAVFQKAAEIARSGQPDLIAAMNEVMANVGTTAPGALLKELDAILPPGLKASATAAGAAIPGALDPAAATAGQSAALTLSQEFAAAGTHIAAVISGMGANMSGLEAVAKTAGQNAAVALSEGFSAAGTHIAAVLRGIAANMKTALGGAKGAAGTAIAIQVNIAPALKQLQSLKVQIGLVKQARPTPVNVNTSAATTAVNRLKSLVNSMPNIRRTITYTYRIVGSKPNPQNISRTITYRYRTVGTRPAQSGMHENLAEDTLIAAHKGERVDISPHTIHTNENRTAVIPTSAGGARPINIVVRGDVNGKELIRFVKFNLMEGTGGVM